MTNDQEKKFAERVDTHLTGTAQTGNDEAWETVYALRPDLAPAPNVKHEELVDALNTAIPKPVNRSMRWRAAALILSAAAAVLIFVPMPKQEVLVYTAEEQAPEAAEVSLEASTKEEDNGSIGVAHEGMRASPLSVTTKAEVADLQLDARATRSEGFAGGAAGAAGAVDSTDFGSKQVARPRSTSNGPVSLPASARTAPQKRSARTQAEIPTQQALAPAQEMIAEISEDEPILPQTQAELLATIQPPAVQGAATALNVAKEFIKRKDLKSADIAVKMGLKFGETPSRLALQELEIWLKENTPPTP